MSGLTWSGSAQAITSLTLKFSAPLDPSFVTDTADYHLVKLAGGQAISIASITYDPTTFLGDHRAAGAAPLRPVRSDPGRRHRVRRALRDIAGNILDGAGNGRRRIELCGHVRPGHPAEVCGQQSAIP